MAQPPYARRVATAPGSRHRLLVINSHLALAHIAVVGAIRMNFAGPTTYAPDLNPVEYLWAWLKRHALANYCPNNLDELHVSSPLAGCRLLDADISKFFDTIEHDGLIKFIEHRVADKAIVRLIRKWLNAGVLEGGRRTQSVLGTVQGGSISPLLANIYLHYVDLWGNLWRERHARGDVVIVRYADDWVAGVEFKGDAERFAREVNLRLGQFGLKLHPEKTWLIEFGRFAQENRRRAGRGNAQTFDLLGFTHCWARPGQASSWCCA